MSDEPKTLTLTLEEAMRAVHWGRLDELREKHGNLADVQMEITETGWWVFLNNDGKSKNQIKEFTRWEDAASFALGVPVVARDEAAELREENKRLSASVDDLLLAPNPLDDENMRLRAEAAELRAALRTLVTDLEALMDYYSLRHDYTGEGYPEEVGWHDVLQGGRDNYLTNWNEAKRLAGGESEK